MWSQQSVLGDLYQRAPPQPYYTTLPPNPLQSLPAAAATTPADGCYDPYAYQLQLQRLAAPPAELENLHDITPPESDPGVEETGATGGRGGRKPGSSGNSGTKPFHCTHPKCKYVTNRRNNLKRHMVTMHERLNKPQDCCGLVFHRKADLRIHNKEFHSQGFLCSWPTCGKSFLRKALLDRHLKVHTGEKPFICSFCQYGTSHKSNLDRHIKIHFKEDSSPQSSALQTYIFDNVRTESGIDSGQASTADMYMMPPLDDPSISSSSGVIGVSRWPNLQRSSFDSELEQPDSTGSELSTSSQLELSPPPTYADWLTSSPPEKAGQPCPTTAQTHPFPPNPVTSNTSDELLRLAAHQQGAAAASPFSLPPSSTAAAFGGSLLQSPEKTAAFSFPAYDLSSITSILLSPIKAERDEVDLWLRQGELVGRDVFNQPVGRYDLDDQTLLGRDNKVSHTINHILGI